jgi:hypothetical protein
VKAPRWLTNNIGLKATSLALTMALYGVVVAGRTYEREVAFTPVLENVPPGFVVATELPEVLVRLQATPRGFAALGDPERRTIRIPVAGRDQREVRLSEADIPLPRGVSVLSMQPERLAVRLDRVVRRSLPVRAAVRGTPAPGYDVLATRSTPSTVLATGPESFFSNVTALETEPIDVEGAREPVTARVGLSAGRSVLTTAPDVVEVRVSIDSRHESASFKEVPVEVIGPMLRAGRVEPRTVTVRLRGPKALIEEIVAGELAATVDAAEFADRGPGRYVASPTVINLPPEVEVQSVAPRTVRLTLDGPPSTPPAP